MTSPGVGTRINARADRFAAVEACRGLACLLVLAHHCGASIGRPPFAVHGFTGVHFFFVLSGFLLYRPFAVALRTGNDWPATGRYLARRLIRIMPPFWVALAVFVALRSVAGVNTPTPWDVVSRALLIFNYDPWSNYFGINAVFWSLAIEVQFYVLLPVVALAVRRFRGGPWVAVALFAVVGILARTSEFLLADVIHGRSVDGVKFRSVFAHLDLFAAGMAVAVWHSTAANAELFERSARMRWTVLAFATVAFLLGNSWVDWSGDGQWQKGGPLAFVVGFSPVVCLACAAMLAVVITTPAAGLRWLLVWPLLWVGQISYSLYLYHIGVQFVVLKLQIGTNWPWALMTWTNAVVSAVPSIAVASVMYWLVEAPCLRRIEAMRTRRAKPTTTAPLPAEALLGP